MIRRELDIWNRLSHPNIVPFLGIAYGFGKPGSISLVSLWMPHGTLHAFLEVHDNQLSNAHRLQLLLDIAEGLQYLHSFPMIHGDLSSNNVLLDHNYKARLTDFGCASLVGEIPTAFAYLQMSTVGPRTLRWAAPEHFSLCEDEIQYTVKSDIYSFGNMALLVLSGKHPWSEVRVDAAVMLRLSQGFKPSRPHWRPIHDSHWELIERCWSLISERPAAGDVVSSLRWFLGACSPPQPLHEILHILTRPQNSAAIHPSRPPQSASVQSKMAHQSRIQYLSPPAACQCPLFKQVHSGVIRPQLPQNKRQYTSNNSEDTAINNDTVIARYLPMWLDEERARKLFRLFGELKWFRLIQEDGDGSKRIALLEYVDAAVADVAIKRLNGFPCGSRFIVVNKAATSPVTNGTDRSPMRPQTATKSAEDKIPIPANKEISRIIMPQASCLKRQRSITESLVSDSTLQSKRTRYSLEDKPKTKKCVIDVSSDGPLLSSKWVRGMPLGKGTRGRVYLALNTSTGEIMTAKQVEKSNNADQDLDFVADLKREREIYGGLDHPHVVASLGSEETTTHLSIFLEYTPGGSIASRLREHGKFNREVIKSFTAQMFDGLAYLHANRIIHGNIEINNILVDESGTCKISGFGSARHADDDQAPWTPMHGLWNAPELTGTQYRDLDGSKVDIWDGGLCFSGCGWGGQLGEVGTCTRS